MAKSEILEIMIENIKNRSRNSPKKKVLGMNNYIMQNDRTLLKSLLNTFPDPINNYTTEKKNGGNYIKTPDIPL